MLTNKISKAWASRRSVRLYWLPKLLLAFGEALQSLLGNSGELMDINVRQCEKGCTNTDRVAFGIAIGFAFNLIFYTAPDRHTTLHLILGAPFVPSIFLLVSLYFCPESPRYYMRRRSAHFDPKRAYGIILTLRREEVSTACVYHVLV